MTLQLSILACITPLVKSVIAIDCETAWAKRLSKAILRAWSDSLKGTRNESILHGIDIPSELGFHVWEGTCSVWESSSGLIENRYEFEGTWRSARWRDFKRFSVNTPDS